MYHIRKVVPGDILHLKNVLDSSELFPSVYLDDMIAAYLSNPNTEEIWFAAVDASNVAVGFGYCVPEKLTNETYNLLAIAVRRELQGQGIGQNLIGFIETYLTQHNKRLLIIETSSTEQFERTRKFYVKLNYQQIAAVKDFWNDGEDKIIFWKKLN